MSIAKKSVKWLVAAILVFALVLTAAIAVGSVATAHADDPVPTTAKVIVVASSDTGSYPYFPTGVDHTITVKYYFEIPTVENETQYQLTVAPTLNYASSEEGADVLRPASITFNTAKFNITGKTGADTYLEGYIQENNPDYDENDPDPTAPSSAITIAFGAKPTSGVDNDAISGADNYLFEATFEIDELAAPGQYDLGLTRADSVFAAGYSPKAGVNYTYSFYEISGADETETSFYLNTAIPVPTAVEDLVYDSTLQTGVASGTGYSLTDNEEYDAGDYEATASVSAGYIWITYDANENVVYTTVDQTIPWSIDPAEATISVGAGSATYNEPISAPDISYSGFYGSDADLLEATVTGLPSQGDNVGIYPISASYEPDSNYNITVIGNNFTITPVVVAVPSGESLPYSGSEQTGVAAVNNAPYVLTGTTAATNVGQYSATASLNHVGDVYNYVWEGFTGEAATSDKTINWSITPAIIDLPQAVTGLIYNGSEQPGVADPGENDHYTVTGNKATNAGDYNASVTPADNYAFYINEQYVTAAQNVAWSIEPKAASISVANASSAYNDSANFAIPSISYSGFLTAADETNLGATIVTAVTYNSNVGDYSMTINYTDNSNYDISVTNGTYTITPAMIAKPSVTDEFVYDGELKVAVSAGTGYTLSGTYEATDANQYEATATLDSNYAWNDDTTDPYVINWVINKATNVITVTGPDSVVYGTAITIGTTEGTTFTYSLLYEGTGTTIVWWKHNESWENIGITAPTNFGTYKVTVTVSGTANYNSATGSKEFTITRATVPVPTANTGLVYDGTEKTGVADPAEDAGYTLTGNTATNAGNYTATATLDDNHAWEGGSTEAASINWSIAPKAASITVGNGTSAYGVTPTTPGITYVGFLNGDENNLGASVTGMPTASSNVGSYDLSATYTSNSNYSITLTGGTYTITPATIAVPTAVTGLVYDGNEKTGVNGGTGYTLSDNVKTNAGEYTATATLNHDGEIYNYVWEGYTGVDATSDKSIEWSIAKANQSVTFAWTEAVTIDELDDTVASRLYNTQSVAIGTEFTVTAQSDGAKTIVAADSNDVLTITAVGTYTFRVRVAGNTNYNDGYTGVYTIEIKPADVKVYLVAKMGTSTVYLQYAAGAYTEVQEPTVSMITMGQSLPAAPAYRYLYTQGFSDGNAIVTGALAYTDQINTYTATYQTNVGIGDMNGDGRIGATDLIVIQRLAAGMIGSARKINLVYPSDPEDAEAYQSGVVDKIWARRNDTSESFNYTFSNVADIDGNGFSSSDIVAMREALATGYTYKIITNFEEGNVTGQFVGSVARVTVTTYQELVDKVMSGYPVLLGNDITDMSRDIFADVEDFSVMGTTVKVYNVNVDIDLGGYTLRVNSFNLNNTAAEAILKVANGNIFTVDGINITAPNGNIILTDVNGYNYEGKSVNLAAASSSLHMDGEVGFYLYKIKDLDVDSAKTAIAGGSGIEDYVDEDQTQVETFTFDQIVNNRISTTDTKIAAAKVIKESTDYVDETERAEALDAINVKKSPITVPVRTHVVVEEQANLVVENIKVVAVSEEDTTSATFSIEVKNADAEVLTVDVSEELAATEGFVVNEITVGGEGTVEVVKGGNTSVAEVVYVASIGSTNYETFEAAVDAAQNGDTIKLLRDVTFGTDRIAPAWIKAFDIDLNGKKITNNSEVKIHKVGKTSDSYTAATLCYSFYTEPLPAVTVSNGTIETAYGAGIYADDRYLDMTLENLTINAAKTGVQDTAEYSTAVRITCTSRVTINSGTYRAVTTGAKALAISNSGGYITINGGTFYGPLYFSASTGHPDFPDLTIADKSITIYGGTFNNVGFENTNAGTLKIYGGTFDADPSQYVAEGYVATVVGDKWVVTADNAVVSVNGVGYPDLVAAVAALKDGDTITLLSDIDFSDELYVGYKWAGSTYNPLEILQDNITFDLNGHTISNMGNTALAAGHLLAKDGRISNFTIKNGTLSVGQTDGVNNSYALLIAGVDGALVKNVTTFGGINVCSGSNDVVIDSCTIQGTKYYSVCTQTGASAILKDCTVTKNTDSTVANKSMFWIQGAGTDGDMQTDLNPTGSFGASSITLESGSYTVDTTNGGVFYLTSGVKPVVKGGTYNIDPTACLADGYSVIPTVVNEQTLYVVEAFTLVTNEAELNAALAIGGNIKFGANITSANGYLVNTDATIDMNGYTLTVTSGSNASNRAFKVTNGTLEIYNGTIDAQGTKTSNCYGTIRMEIGTNLIAHDLVLKNYRGNGLSIKVLGATADLNNIEFISEWGGAIEVTDDEGADGTVVGYAKMTNCVVTQSGYYDWCSSAVTVSGKSTLDVYSTTYTAETAIYVFSSGGTINIYGGTYTGSSNAIVVASDLNEYPTASCVVNVYDGAINGTFSHSGKSVDKINIYGGTFDHDPTAYVPAGYAIAEDNGLYTVSALTTPVCIGHVGYATLQAAIDAIPDNGSATITLLADITDGTGICTFDSHPKTVVIDFNGKTYTVTHGGVGSTGYPTQSMHWCIGSNITLKNGSFVVTEDAGEDGVNMGMQSYGILVVSNMTIDMSGVDVIEYSGYGAPWDGHQKSIFNANTKNVAGTYSLYIENSVLTMPADSNYGVYVNVAGAIIKDTTINGNVVLDEAIASVEFVGSTTVSGGVGTYWNTDTVVENDGVYTIA